MPVELPPTQQTGTVIPVRFIRTIMIQQSSIKDQPQALCTFARVPTIDGNEVGAAEPDGFVALSFAEAIQWPETAPFMARIKQELYDRRASQS